MSNSITRLAAKSVFAAADVGRAFPGPRILIYHQVGANLKREMEVSAATFRRQLEWLQANGEVVSLEDALNRIDLPHSDRLFVLTFDDGYRDMYRMAFPLLLARQLPFTLYLATHPVETGIPLTPGGGAEPVTWDHVRDMLSSGLLTLGSHTHHHVDLRGLAAEDVAEELDTSIGLIKQRTGIEVRHFAYPKGYWSEAAEPLVKARFITAVLGGGDPVVANTDPHRIHRIPIQRSDGMAFFRRKMKGGMRMEEKVRRQVRRYGGVKTTGT